MRVARTLADVAHSLQIALGPGGSVAGARGGDGGAPLRAQPGGLAPPSRKRRQLSRAASSA
eukprot:251816-Heterocapsa_arctica.AAC.1